MPILNGFETLRLVKEQFERHNKRLNNPTEQRRDGNSVPTLELGDEGEAEIVNSNSIRHVIQRPLIIFVSQLDPK